MKIQLTFIFCCLSLNLSAAEPPKAVQDLLTEYQQQGNLEAGKTLWQKQATHKKKPRSCGSCHGDDLTQMGKHLTTGKVIQPMAFSVNPERYQQKKKIKKWLKRNCKWTFGRECSVQEKADILQYLIEQ